MKFKISFYITKKTKGAKSTFLQELNEHDIKIREHFINVLQDMDFITNEENIS